MKRAKILVINPCNRDLKKIEKVLAEIFIKNGGEVFCTTLPEKGIELLQREKPRLLFINEEIYQLNTKLWDEQNVEIVLIQSILKVDVIIRKCQDVFSDLDTPSVIPI